MTQTMETPRDESILAETFQDESIHEKWESVYRGNPAQDCFNDDMLARLLKICDLAEGANVLDAGCGVGDHTFRLARHGFRCVGVDISEPMLAHAREIAANTSTKYPIEFACASLEKLNFDRQFDLIHCRGVLMHIPNWRAALSSLCKLTAEDGRIMIWENNHRSLEMKIVGLAAVLRKPSRDRIANIDGIEFHDRKDGFAPLTRVANLRTLQSELEQHGVDVEVRRTSEFFDINRFPEGLLRNAAVRFNRICFSLPGTATLACGNVLIGKRNPRGVPPG
ncbi:MAG: class I SAM-dependent methyltransferase [Planctomycetales bacterium]|nr:class I SAM-dependent methyltransferase [Planctomycetales bacterium]